jgi:hypothetical protein
MKAEDDWERGGLRHPDRVVLGGGSRQNVTMKRGMKINVNNNEIRSENCVLEQVCRLKIFKRLRMPSSVTKLKVAIMGDKYVVCLRTAYSLTSRIRNFVLIFSNSRGQCVIVCCYLPWYQWHTG